jgi:small-conductance mechanosensitive channel
MENILNSVYFGNSVFWYIAAFDIFLATLIVLFLAHKISIHRLTIYSEKTITKLDDLVLNLLLKLGWPFYLIISLNTAIVGLNIEAWVTKIINIATIIVLCTYVVVILKEGTNFWLLNFARKQEDKQDPRSKSMVYIIGLLSQILIWIVASLSILSILEINITALVGTLGIGGIAIAFALQSILSDVFASFSIYFDRPFAVGDFIQIGLDSGTVEQIGIKSTRIKTLQGQIIIVPNKELTSLRVQNFSHLEARRGKITFSVALDTSNRLIEEIPKAIESIIKKQKQCEFDRCHFEGVGVFGLDFETIYYVKSTKYNVYMDVQQTINLELKAYLEQNKIKIVLPNSVLLER